MVINPICDVCREAVALHVVYESKWKQVAMCDGCHDDIDHEVVYDCKILVPDIKAKLVEVVDEFPDATTAQITDWFVKNTVVPVYLAPFDTAVKEALRDREVFEPVKVEGRGNSLSYKVIRTDG